jgi:transposase-like protein
MHDAVKRLCRIVEKVMTKKRHHRSSEFTFRLALEAAKEQKTLSQRANEYEVHPTQSTQWKKQALDDGSMPVSSSRTWRVKPSCSSRLVGSKWSWRG